MLIPEITLYNTLKGIIKFVADDYKNATDKTKTILNDLFATDNNNNQIVLEKFNYLNQAIAVFTRTKENPRYLEVNIGYNLNRTAIPTIHIILPQDAPGRYNSIGFGEGVEPEIADFESQTSISTRSNTYRTTFNLLITSDNTSEVLLIYYFLKAMLLFVGDTFELLGLHNLRISGQDVQLDQDKAPNNIFHRNLNIEFDYENQVKVRLPKEVAEGILFTICNEIGDETNELLDQINH